MKKIFAKLFGSAGGGIVDSISGVVDKFVQTKEEKAQFEKELTEIFLNAETEMQKNITERWKADTTSDSWLSKNVRPLVLIFLVVSTVLLIFVDAGIIQFEVKANWVDLLQLTLITVISAYFGGRSFEKINKNKK
jgi:cation transport ATPase